MRISVPDSNAKAGRARRSAAILRTRFALYGSADPGGGRDRALFHALITNLIWSSTRLGEHRIICDMSPMALIWITVSNFVLVAVTLGLFVPWAWCVWRGSRWRNELLPASDLQEFAAAEPEASVPSVKRRRRRSTSIFLCRPGWAEDAAGRLFRRAHDACARCQCSLAGEDLIVAGEDVDLRVPFAGVRVDEQPGPGAAPASPTGRHILRGARPGRPRCVAVVDAHRDGWVDRMQRRAKYVLYSLVACVLLAIAAYRWGLPWAAASGARHLPAAVGVALSAQTLKVLDGGLLLSSQLSGERQRALGSQFHALRLPQGGHAIRSCCFAVHRSSEPTPSHCPTAPSSCSTS